MESKKSMTETEEFEFRARREKEKAAKPTPVEKPEPAEKPSLGKQVLSGAGKLAASGLKAKEALPGQVAAFGRGLSSEILGMPGAIESMITPTAKGELKGHETVFPTPEEIRQGYSKIGFEEPKTKQLQAIQTAGEFTPLAAAGGTLLKKGLGLAGEKLGSFAQSFKSPQPIANVEGLTSVGEKGFKLLTDKAKKLFDARSSEAEKKYGEAFDAARKAQAQGQPFASSPQGRSLIQSLDCEYDHMPMLERQASLTSRQ
jgi:hypothetical protein